MEFITLYSTGVKYPRVECNLLLLNHQTNAPNLFSSSFSVPNDSPNTNSVLIDLNVASATALS